MKLYTQLEISVLALLKLYTSYWLSCAEETLPVWFSDEVLSHDGQAVRPMKENYLLLPGLPSKSYVLHRGPVKRAWRNTPLDNRPHLGVEWKPNWEDGIYLQVVSWRKAYTLS